MKIHPAAFILVVFLAPILSSAQNDSLAEADRAFLQKAAQANLAEIDAGKLAQEKSTRNDIKQFGKTMEQDHGKTLDELKPLAAAKGVSLPTEPDPPHKALATQLSRAEGKEFDRIYVGNAGLADHKAAKQLFESGAKSKDPEVKAFATKTLPHIKHHLEMAEQLAAAK